MVHTTWPKRLIVIILITVHLGLSLALEPAVSESVRALVLSAFMMLAVALCSRWFRGQHEPPGASRAWWRATADAWASWTLAIIWGLVTVLRVGASIAEQRDIVAAIALVGSAALGTVFFCHSALRLEGHRPRR